VEEGVGLGIERTEQSIMDRTSIHSANSRMTAQTVIEKSTDWTTKKQVSHSRCQFMVSDLKG
jgi:hypothetical protein